jgi:predicted outer membrane repeat protein
MWSRRDLPGDPDVVVSDCVFRGNVGDFWGDVIEPSALSGSTGLVVLRCSFVENAGLGPALKGVSVVEGCQFTRNYASMDSAGATLWNATVTDCAFTENKSENAGGALRLGSGSNTVLRCVFRNNSASSGGAIECGGNAEIRECLFAGNMASACGGACSQGAASVRVIGCVFIGNRSGVRGGAWLEGWYSSLNMIGCTASLNRSLQEGCFIAANPDSGPDSGPISLANCILSDGDKEISGAGSPVKVTYTCLAKGSVDQNDPNGWLAWGPGNIVADPCFARPGYWDPNGTPDDANDDFFIEGDYHLKSQAGRWYPNSKGWVTDSVTSPCIDAGDPNSPVGDEPEPNGGRINMGAYGGTAEASKSYVGQPAAKLE